MKALPINVYKSNHGDCSNGGITSKYSELLLIHDRGYIDIDENNLPENLVKIVTRRLFGKTYMHIEPVKPVSDGCIGYMAGGAIGYSCDGRFSELSEYPLNIHDRQESQSLYNQLSH